IGPLLWPSRDIRFPSGLHSRAALRTTLLQPAAPVPPQPTPRSAVLRLAPGRSGRHGRAVHTVGRPAGGAEADTADGAAPKDRLNLLSAGFIFKNNCVVLLVTLDKSTKAQQYRYEDRFEAPDWFQWQSCLRLQRGFSVLS